MAVERWKVNALECEQVKFMQRLNVGTLACQSVGRLEHWHIPKKD
jgi:hypothetical protein